MTECGQERFDGIKGLIAALSFSGLMILGKELIQCIGHGSRIDALVGYMLTSMRGRAVSDVNKKGGEVTFDD